MDSKYLEGLLQQLSEMQESIKKTAQYCASYPESAGLVVFMISNEFTSARKDRKKLYLFLIHQIILEEKALKRPDHPYVIKFGGHLKQIFLEYSNMVDDIKDMDKAYTIIKRWEKDQIYHPEFLDKLRNILQPKFDQLKQQQETFNALNQKDASAHKVLLHNITIVQSQEQSKRIYYLLNKLSDIDNKALDFNCNYEKILNLKAPELEQMIEQGELCRSNLIEVLIVTFQSLCELQSQYKEMAMEGEQLLNDFTCNSTKLDYYKDKKRELFRQ